MTNTPQYEGVKHQQQPYKTNDVEFERIHSHNIQENIKFEKGYY